MLCGPATTVIHLQLDPTEALVKTALSVSKKEHARIKGRVICNARGSSLNT